MAINTSRVIAGGLVAGVVANVVDFVGNGVIMKDSMSAQLNALKPGLAATMAAGNTIAQFVGIDFLFGIVIVFVYAAIRPRFGAGPKTAFYAGLIVWIVGGLVWADVTALGIFPWSAFPMGAIEALVSCVAAALVGGMIYKEEATPA